jgi:hypothetical protein
MGKYQQANVLFVSSDGPELLVHLCLLARLSFVLWLQV